jgi:hypothetical protein
MVFELTNGFYPVPGGENGRVDLDRFHQDFFTVEYQTPALVLAVTVSIITYLDKANLFIHKLISEFDLNRNVGILPFIANVKPELR